MENKRRAKELDLTPNRPWPTIQRRKIEKLRNQRQEEFERACMDNFNWLENYYQGCVYAAKQNKRSQPSITNRIQTADNRETETPQNTTTSAVNQGDLLFEENIHPLPTKQNEDRELHERSTTPTATTSSSTLLGDTTSQDSPRLSRESVHRNRSKTSSVHFQLKSPRTPKLYSPIRSPQSPYERQRITPRRSRLRVDATAATRRAIRAAKSARKRPSSYGLHNGPHSPDTTMQLLSTQDIEMQQDTQGAVERNRSKSKEPPSSNRSSQLSHRGSDANEVYFSSKETLVNSSTMDVSFSGSENSYPIKTPSKGPIGQRLIRLALDDDTEDMDGLDFHATPGSRARDSMTLISPAAWSGSSKGRDSTSLASASALSKTHNQGQSEKSLLKRGSQGMDLDQDIPIQYSNYTRTSGSPFQDSIAPVRFGSPGADSAKYEVPVPDLKEVEENPKSQNSANISLSNSLQTEISRNRGTLNTSVLESSVDKRQNNQRSTQANDAQRPPTHADDDHRKQNGSNVKNESVSYNTDRSTSNALQETVNSRKEFQDSTRNPFKASSDEVSNISTKSSNSGEGVHRPSYPSAVERERAQGKLDHSEPTGTLPTSKDNAIDGHHSRATAASRSETPETRDSYASVSSSSEISSSTRDNNFPRSRVATTLPEKRIVGQRKPFTSTSSSQPQPTGSNMPPSRLLRINSSSTTTNQTTSSQGTSSSSQALSSTTQTSTRIIKTTLSNPPQQSTQAVGTKSTSSTLSASNLLRQGVPRAPLPSMRATESSLARSESQNALPRKPFLISKSAFSIKKPTRPVLPDSTLTAKSAALSGISVPSSSRPGPPISPKKDFKREMTPVESRRREQTPDIAPRANGSSAQPSSSNTSVGTANTPALMLKNSLAAIATSGREARNKETPSSTTTQRNTNGNSTNPFLAPAPLPASNHIQMRGRPNQEETILPEIGSETEEFDPDSGEPVSLRGTAVPDWAEWDELEKTMRKQSQMNPEDIFGPLPVLDMSEIFPGKEKTSRARTSSAHWGVADRLTPQEVMRYNEEMGWSTKD
ncbi:hypothetical protein BGZ46_002476 [Entomortierella lignicola]|nr:hypothetical protein BGZ46_002476 [Entomortierella lignicola]